MAHRTLKTKATDRALLDRQLFTLPEVAANRLGRRPARRWGSLPTVFSLVVHGALMGLFWLQPAKDRGLLGIDTRVAESLCDEPEAATEFFLAGPEARARPRPEAPTPLPAVSNPTPPVVLPVHREAPARSTAPLNPLFNQRLGQGEPAHDSALAQSEQGRRLGAGAQGVPAFFGIAAHGARILYVVDRSSSMGETGALTLARRELRASLERLPAASSFQVIAYNRSAEPLRVAGQSNFLPATPENKRQAASQIDRLRAEGGTEHLPALRRALQMQPDVLFFLTDADALTDEQVRTVTRWNQGRTVIHTIEMGASRSSERRTPLQLLARDNRGTYRAVKQTYALSIQSAP